MRQCSKHRRLALKMANVRCAPRVMHYFDHDSALTQGRLLRQVDIGGTPIANIGDQPVVADHSALNQAATSGTPQRIVTIYMMSSTAVCHVSAPLKDVFVPQKILGTNGSYLVDALYEEFWRSKW